MYLYSALGIILIYQSTSLGLLLAFAIVSAIEPIISLSCLVARLIGLFGILFHSNLIVISERVTFRGRDSVIASYDVCLLYLEPLDTVSDRLIGLLPQVEQMVKVLIDCSLKLRIDLGAKYDDTLKVFKIALGIGIPFALGEGGHSEPPWWNCFLDLVSERGVH
ncbi:unnamed protein product [Prunus brigantina]